MTNQYSVLVFTKDESLEYGPTDDVQVAQRWFKTITSEHDLRVFDPVTGKRKPAYKTDPEFHGRALTWTKVPSTFKPQVLLVEYPKDQGNSALTDN